MYGNPRACAALAPCSNIFINQEYSTAVVVYTAASDATDEVQLLLMLLVLLLNFITVPMTGRKSRTLQLLAFDE
jgi:hypothetical protein